MQTLECVLWHGGLKCEVVFDQGSLSRGGLLYCTHTIEGKVAKLKAGMGEGSQTVSLKYKKEARLEVLVW